MSDEPKPPYAPRVEVEIDPARRLVLMTETLFEFLVEAARQSVPDQILVVAYGEPKTEVITYYVPTVSGRGRGPEPSPD